MLSKRQIALDLIIVLGARPKQGSFDSIAWSSNEAKPMESNLFWFSDDQWSKIVPHLPTNQPGPEREDDRRVLSGIMHVLPFASSLPWPIGFD
jgi:hypothetical protein